MNIAISTVSIMELYYGALNKKELVIIKNFIGSFEIIHIDHSISGKAVELVEKYAKSHNLDIPDSLIAATSIITDTSLFTYNYKDFHYIDGIKLV